MHLSNTRTTSASHQDMLTLTPDTAGRRPRDHRHRRRQSRVDHDLRLCAGAAGLDHGFLGGQESPSNAGYQYLCVVSKQTLAATSTTWKWRGACTCASSASRRCRPPRPSQSGGARRDIRHHRQRRQSRHRRAAAGRHAGKRSPKFSPRAISASNRLTAAGTWRSPPEG